MTESVLLQAGRAETTALGKAIAALRTAPGGREQLAQQMEMLTAHCLAYPAEMRRLWEGFEKTQPCAEVDVLVEVFERHLGLIDDRLQIVNEVRSLTAERSGARVDDAAFAQAVDDLLALRGRIAGVRDFFLRPLPPWPEPQWTTADCRAAFERGEYETIESIIARVQAGGPVCKDDAE
jgi:hypothetical protein